VQSNRNARRVTKRLADNPLYANHEAHQNEVILLHERTILEFMRLLREQAGGPLQFSLDSGGSEETIAVIEDKFLTAPGEADGKYPDDRARTGPACRASDRSWPDGSDRWPDRRGYGRCACRARGRRARALGLPPRVPPGGRPDHTCQAPGTARRGTAR